MACAHALMVHQKKKTFVQKDMGLFNTLIYHSELQSTVHFSKRTTLQWVNSSHIQSFMS